MAKYPRDQPEGWLAAHRLMKSVRHDTLHQLPPLSADGRTRIAPPGPDRRASLKTVVSAAELAVTGLNSVTICLPGEPVICGWTCSGIFTHALLQTGKERYALRHYSSMT
ncbi:type VI secretion system domain-containing protein [Escherichia coli]|nr:type VI secretion system domain-containing protein [Escherichia coli]